MILSLEELSRQAIELRNDKPKCIMKHCASYGLFRPCYLQTQLNCPIYYAIYHRLTDEQRDLINDPSQLDLI